MAPTLAAKKSGEVPTQSSEDLSHSPVEVLAFVVALHLAME